MNLWPPYPRTLFATLVLTTAGFGNAAGPALPTAQHSATVPRLRLSRDGADYVVTSTAPPTWKVVLAGTKQATNEHPGAGTIRALHLPANAAESVVESTPGKFCCAGWGLDHLEWRYVDPGPPSKGIRAPSGTRAVTEKFELVRETPDEITLRFTGHWQNVLRFTRTITLNPRRLAVRIEADWDGREGAHSMWWVMSLFRASWVEGAAVMVRDADTPAVPLPIARGQVFPLPNGIGFPYEVIFPLKQGPLRQLVLRVAQHGDNTPAGLRYELWPEIDGYHMFYPRWVIKGFKQKTYVFDYAWRFDDPL